MYITIELLQDRRACHEQVDLFAATFPEGVHVTEAMCLAVYDKFDFDWAARHLLPPWGVAEYKAKHALIRAEYKAKHDPIRAEYKAKHAPIRAEYEAKHDPIWAEYEAKHDPIRAEYPAKHALIRAEYKRQQAVLFCRIAETLED